ncbi:MAG: hypothetical protein CMJ18_17180 [Phycisphaeraceae bacterium]|nr:hypothetical protein [Phycisphaeraceae bacterium]
MRPDFVIIGAPKSATTFVHFRLIEHPDVYMDPDEVPWFCDPDYREADFPEFLARFEAGHGRAAVGFKRPDYLARREVSPRLARHLPDARIIAVLRDPVDRAVSHYHHLIGYGFAPVRDVNRGLDQVLVGDLARAWPRTEEILEAGFYGAQIERYLGHFPRERMLILLHEQVHREPAETMRRVFRFLEIDEAFEPEHLDQRPQAVVYDLKRLRWRRLRNTILYRHSPDRMRLFPRDRIGPLSRSTLRGIDWVDRRLLARWDRARRPELNDTLVARLADYYRADTERLEALLGADLHHWRVFGTEKKAA